MDLVGCYLLSRKLWNRYLLENPSIKVSMDNGVHSMLTSLYSFGSRLSYRMSKIENQQETGKKHGGM